MSWVMDERSTSSRHRKSHSSSGGGSRRRHRSPSPSKPLATSLLQLEEQLTSAQAQAPATTSQERAASVSCSDGEVAAAVTLEVADLEEEVVNEEAEMSEVKVVDVAETSEAGLAKPDDDGDLEQGVPHTPEVQDVKCSSPCGKCRIVDEFEKLGRLGEGAYGVVYKARDKRTEEIVALKKIKMHNQETEGFPVTSLREINLLISLRHPAIVDVREVVIGKDMDSVFMVMEYIERNLKDVMAALPQPWEHAVVKHMMQQLLDAVAYLHANWVLHRDLKPSNILVSGGELKICDFGMARRYDSPIKAYTHKVVTMWYRAPELLASTQEEQYHYTAAVDVWSLGCIMAELILNETLFQGTSEIDQLRRIKKMVWTAQLEKPGFIFPAHKLSALRDRILYPAAQAGRPMLSEKGLDLLAQLLAYDPDKRISANAALAHPWFQEPPLPTPPPPLPALPLAATMPLQ
ncbi:cyclin-dependent kinase 11 isoform X2 [Selaginella moellendorffii]|uniref:cyclin-dependent kinase 11 isoform X2 n=1 Tax=Selaginella moellendorffii TaxID=88036 RepID=UPI000D1C9402|nr:cyclin-dependent kinase 11 isoform X2 [Selaginella moellendorffii]|eukprot:XP_024536164.1 cyclin-dependent kinase 11 isoform X2 [Selaginella moellendorffii]